MANDRSIGSILLDHIPLDAGRVLGIGCGGDALGQAFCRRQPRARYVAVEPGEDLARVGDGFDAIVLGEGFTDAHAVRDVLAKVRSLTVAGGVCVLVLPNPAHWSALQQRVGPDHAEFSWPEPGDPRFSVLDRAVDSLRDAGWTFIDAFLRVVDREETDAAVAALAPLAERLQVAPERLRRDLATMQWVICAINGPAPPRLDMVGLGLKKVAGVTDARIDHPLAALRTLPGVRAVWDSGHAPIPRYFEPGIVVLHRQFLDDPALNAGLDRLIAKGWVIVSEIDDDPHRWPEYAANDFRAFRGVHAVTVSTEPLAATIRSWNPTVQVFPNAMFALPRSSPATPKQGDRLRLFFGALNRGRDWAAIRRGVLAAAATLGDAVEFVVVHDREIYDDLPAQLNKTFHATLPYDRYIAVLATCDVALLPLEDTPFNRQKSDLKFIECCAAGVVPICSPLVYADRAEHHAIGLFATDAGEWRDAIKDLCGSREMIARRRLLGIDYVGSKRMHGQQVAARARFYRDLLARREVLEEERRLRLAALGG